MKASDLFIRCVLTCQATPQPATVLRDQALLLALRTSALLVRTPALGAQGAGERERGLHLWCSWCAAPPPLPVARSGGGLPGPLLVIPPCARHSRGPACAGLRVCGLRAAQQTPLLSAPCRPAGEENLDFVDSLRQSGRIRLIVTRHEQAAAMMAATVGRLTGPAQPLLLPHACPLSTK